MEFFLSTTQRIIRDLDNINSLIEAYFTVGAFDAPANTIVPFTDLSTPPEIITGWEWDFGDDTPHSTEQNPLHVYTQAGIYPVTLRAFSEKKSNISASKEISVTMIAGFSVKNETGNSELLVQFLDESLGVPTSWLWDFGDGNTSTEQNPCHRYTKSGNYTVSLTSSRESGVGPYTDTEVKTDIVTVYTKADFIGTPRVGCNSVTVQFSDLSKGSPTSWYWDFGDGECSTEVEPLHTYKFPGIYSVQLTVKSSFNTHTEYKTNYIIVEGTATPNIAPESYDILNKMGDIKAYKDSKGIKISFLRKRNIS
jgi:PKD repeat protein